MRWSVVVAAILWQAAWYAALSLAGHGAFLWAALVPLIVILLHLSIRPPQRVWLGVGLALIGPLVIDGLMSLSGLIAYERSFVPAPLAPPYIVGIWLLYVAGLQRVLPWLRDRLWVAIALILPGAPFAYEAGRQLGAVQFPAGMWPAYAALAVAYCIATVLILMCAVPPAAERGGR